MKYVNSLILFFLLQCLPATSFATHILGGEIRYDYVGLGTAPNTKRYSINLILFRFCENAGAPMPNTADIRIFNRQNNSPVLLVQNIQRSQLVVENRNDFSCFTGYTASFYCRQRGYYTTTVDLPDNSAGYMIVYQTCCRVNVLQNLQNNFAGNTNSGSQGSTFFTYIPGTASLPTGNNSSPRFYFNDTAIICNGSSFSFLYNAFDPDGDSLSYEFCESYQTTSITNAGTPVVPDPPPYNPASYNIGFSGNSPMGSSVTINPANGRISGIGPNALGRYVISICVKEWRNSQFINSHYIDAIVSVEACQPLNPQLNIQDTYCDTTIVNFVNTGTNPNGATYFWDFGDPSTNNDTSTLPNPSYNYPDTGTYLVKLVMGINNGLCKDSVTKLIKVYPGYYPGFTMPSPVCIGSTVQFTDTTRAVFGNVNFWRWDFGVPNLTNDTSRIQNPTYVYTTAGQYTVTLDVASSKGCRDTVTKVIDVLTVPLLQKTNDTLICSIDTLQLNVSETSGTGGTISWTPNYMISSLTSFSPLVSPDVPTTYYFNYVNGTCTKQDSIRVNVLPFITVDIVPDTTICANDPTTLNPISQALQYRWTPTTYLNNPNIKNPIVTQPVPFVKYIVEANLGKCQDRDSINVRTLPFVPAQVSPDTTVCFRTNGIVSATGGISYSWTPTTFLATPNAASSFVLNPTQSIVYTVEVRGDPNLYCAKPVLRTVNFNVLPTVVADAGNDTTIVLGQSLQLQASGGSSYLWTPNQWLNNNTIPNPISTPLNDITYVLEARTNNGRCRGFDEVSIRVLKIPPGFHVPNAFTPNGDGLNDKIRPLMFGMKSLKIFRIFNRYGQMVFETSKIGEGWDGIFKSVEQRQDNFVWYGEGETWDGKLIKGKGNVILLR